MACLRTIRADTGGEVMIDTYWQWMTALVLGLAILLIPIAGWRLYLRTLYTPDVASCAARELPCTPMTEYDVQLSADLIVDASELEEYERLYGRLRMHADVAMQRGKEQLL